MAQADMAQMADERAGEGKRSLACRITGHRWRFWREGTVLRWDCARGCPDTSGQRSYPSREEAHRMLARLDRAPGPPRALLSALAGTVDRSRSRRARE